MKINKEEMKSALLLCMQAIHCLCEKFFTFAFFFLKVLLETNLIIMCIFPNLTLPISVMGNCFMEPDPAINVFEGSECRKIKINFAQKVLITVIFSYSLHCLRSCFHCDFYQFPSLIISFCIGNDLRYRLIQ